MWFSILLVLVVVGLALIVFVNRRTNKADDRRFVSVNQQARDDHYWGVQLMPPQSGLCCALIRQLQGRSFAKLDAPPLPLSGCTMLHCYCYYKQLAERRKLRERRSGKERRQQIRFAPNSARRSTNERRQANRVWNYQYC